MVFPTDIAAYVWSMKQRNLLSFVLASIFVERAQGNFSVLVIVLRSRVKFNVDAVNP